MLCLVHMLQNTTIGLEADTCSEMMGALHNACRFVSSTCFYDLHITLHTAGQLVGPKPRQPSAADTPAKC